MMLDFMTPVPTRKLTPEEVRLALRDFFVNELGVSAREVETRLIAGALAADLISIEPDLDWIEVEHYLGVAIPERVTGGLTPTSTVMEFCEWIAERTSVPVIAPAVVLGRPCLSAGAFLVVRRLLASAGVDASQVGPSSPLDEPLRRCPQVFRRQVALMAPGRMPALHFRGLIHTRCALWMLWGSAVYLAWHKLASLRALFAALGAAVAVAWCVEKQFWLPVPARRWFWAVEYGNLPTSATSSTPCSTARGVADRFPHNIPEAPCHDRVPRPDEEVRGPVRPRPAHAQARPGGRVRVHRPERGRQDDHHAHPRHPAQPELGRGQRVRVLHLHRVERDPPAASATCRTSSACTTT
jgi:hypothetical protein